MERTIETALRALYDGLVTGDAAKSHTALRRLAAGGEDDASCLALIDGFVREVWRQIHDGPRGISAADLTAVAQQAAIMDDMLASVRIALDYLSMWAEANRYFLDNHLEKQTYLTIAGEHAQLSELRSILLCHGQGLRTSYGPRLMDGLVASLHDRQTAAELFREAKASASDFAAAQRLDQFTATYFTNEEIAEHATAKTRKQNELARNLVVVGDPPSGRSTDITFLFSCDPSFFAAFFPYWILSAEYLIARGLHMHFVLVGDRATTQQVIDQALTLVGATARLRGGDANNIGGHLSFSTVSIPDYVSSPKSFYACARYLVVRELSMRLHRKFLVMDIDMVLMADPSEFIRRLAQTRDGQLRVMMAKGSRLLSPARRILAGQSFFDGGDMSHEALKHVEDYMYLGLSATSSWTLDQNALTYGVEQVMAAHGEGSVANIEVLGHPFVQVPIRHLMINAQKERTMIDDRSLP